MRKIAECVAPTRRSILAKTAGALAAVALASNREPNVRAQDDPQPPTARPPTQRTRDAHEPFGYCLNTSTISGANLGIVELIEIASSSGYDAIEPWMRELDEYEKKGGSLADLRKRCADSGLVVADAIGFDEWIVDDDARRAKGLEAMKRDMDRIAQIGGAHVAAPPIGAHESTASPLDLQKAAERYAALLELGKQMGVTPILELWGFSKNLSRLGEVAFVAIESHHPNAAMLLDIYHLHKGGSEFSGLRLINGAALPLLHVNDYPATPPREQITDAQRVYPGDGVAPFREIYTSLRDSGFGGYLSLELFNRDYWKQSPAKVARIGLEKTRETVRSALAG